MSCVFCNKPTSNEFIIDFETEQAVGALCPRHLSMLNDGSAINEEVDGDLTPVCVRSNCSNQPRYGVASKETVTELSRTNVDFEKAPDPVLCQKHYETLR